MHIQIMSKLYVQEKNITPFNREWASLDKKDGSLILSLSIFCWIFCLFPQNGGCKYMIKKLNLSQDKAKNPKVKLKTWVYVIEASN